MSMKLNDRDFERLAAFVQDRYGINLTAKRTLIEARLAFDISRRGFAGFSPYIDFVTAFPDGEECRHMMNRLSTTYSFFFRDTDYISHLKSRAVPDFLKAGLHDLSVWSAGCSSGQEAYSAAMVLSTLAESGGFDFHITGTDINTDVLETARLGRYLVDELESIPQAYRRFVRPAGKYIEICDGIKSHLSWERKNLLEAAPAPGYDIIFCRNVLIYFSPETRTVIADRLYSSLRHGGYLYTGAMEAMDLKARRFTYIAPSIYKKGEPRWSPEK